MGANRLAQAEELGVERSNHGPLFDSFSESCDSQEGSRKGGALAGGPSSGTHLFGSALERLRDGGGFGGDVGGGRGNGSRGRGSSKWRAGRSLHSGIEFYKAQRQQQQDEAAALANRARFQRQESRSVGGGVAYRPRSRPEGSVSRHRGAHFYAEAATRWRAARESGDPRAVAELERTEAEAGREDPAAQPAADLSTAGVFFDFPETCGAGLPARWCHAVTSVGERLYVYGGLGPGDRPLCDIHFFSVTTNMWRPLQVSISSKKDAPPLLWGHAIASSEGKIWVAGGRSKSNKLQRRTFSLDTETLVWRALKDSQHAPAGVADLTLTAAGEHGVVAFGGLGAKRASAQLALLQPETSAWGPLPTAGAPPSARGQHTAVWDGDDSVIVFGGVDGSNAFAVATVHVLSLSRREWTVPDVNGEGPGPRARHCAAMLGQNGGRTMAVFGGRSPVGALLNDVWLLDITAWRWVRGTPLGASPTGREGAAAAVLAGSRIALCGGLSGAGPLDSLLLLSTDFGPELGPLAATLSLARSSAPATSAASASRSGTARLAPAAAAAMPAVRVPTGAPAGAASGTPIGPAGSSGHRSGSRRGGPSGGGSVRFAEGPAPALGGPEVAAVQLTELLRRRNVAEAAAEAGRRAELAERLFQGERRKSQGLQAEVAQLRLLASEAEQAAADGAAALRDETRRAARDQGLMRAELASAHQQIEALTSELAAAKEVATQADRYREAAATAAARERAASDAAAAAVAQCNSLRRRCNDLAGRLHAQRASAAVAAAQSGGHVRHGGPGVADSATAAASASQHGSGRPSTPPAMAAGRLPSIGENDETGDAAGSDPAVAGSSSGFGGQPLTVRTSNEAQQPAESFSDGAAAYGQAAGDHADAFVSSLDSAFERWSMGGAATPPLTPPPPEDESGASSPSPGVLSLLAGALQGGSSGGGGRLFRAQSAPEATMPSAAASPPLSPSAQQLARVQQQQQQARVQAGGWPSRHSYGGGGASAALFPPPLAPTSPPSLRECRRSLDEPGETALREAQAALAAERERCARLAALLTARQQAADERIGSLERRIACLAGDADALSACTAAELEVLEQELDAGVVAVRRAAARAAAREAAAEGATCSLCMERPQGVVFGCGHQVCAQCSRDRCPVDCPFCRQPITTRINVFKS